MFPNFIIQFLCYDLSSGHLWEVKTKEIFQLLALEWSRSRTRGGHLQEVPNIVIWYLSIM